MKFKALFLIQVFKSLSGIPLVLGIPQVCPPSKWKQKHQTLSRRSLKKTYGHWFFHLNLKFFPWFIRVVPMFFPDVFPAIRDPLRLPCLRRAQRQARSKMERFLSSSRSGACWDYLGGSNGVHRYIMENHGDSIVYTHVWYYMYSQQVNNLSIYLPILFISIYHVLPHVSYLILSHLI